MFKEFPDDEAKTDDFLNEFRQKISNQQIETLEEKREELNRSKSIFLGIAGGVTLASVVGWMILAPQYRVESEKEIPVIRRPQTAIRVQPNEPGGMEIPNQDKSVYNIIEKKDDTSIENLLPPPEAPKLPVVVASEEVSDSKVSTESTVIEEAEKVVQQATVSVPTEEILKQAEDAVVQSTENTQTVPVVETQKTDIKVAETLPAKSSNDVKPEIKKDEKPIIKAEIKDENKSVIKEETPKAKQQTAAVSGDWQIQLMSSPNKPAVEKAKIDLGKKYKISHLPFEIEAAILDQNKTFYRLKVGAFKNRADADKVCNDIKTLNGTCIVKKK